MQNMKLIGSFTLIVFFASNNVIAQNLKNCVTADSNLNLNIPCAILGNGEAYSATLNREKSAWPAWQLSSYEKINELPTGGNTLQPNYVPSSGYNLEFRQNTATSDGYIYSHTGADYQVFMDTVYPLLPESVSFGLVDGETSPNAFSKGNPGVTAIDSTAIIYPYPGVLPEYGLPSRLTLLANGKTVEAMLIAQIVSMVPMYDTTNPPTDSFALWSAGTITRHTSQTNAAGQVLQEMVSDDGSERYGLASATSEATDQYDISVVGGLADLPMPAGYHYESSYQEGSFTMSSEQTAYIINDVYFNFQRYQPAE
jgi:hypothetical protein